LHLVAVGRLKAGPERELAERYQARARDAGRAMGFTGPEISELGESKARRGEDRKREEAALIAAQLGPGLVIALDERGRTLDSEAFAAKLSGARDAGQAAAQLIIGGADGLEASLRGRAEMTLSFGALTLPHQLVRVLVLEQLYRAMTILAGHPYHRV
jgi:23S rRNA (pseudouridine1915-N3)-methyltransferase